MLNTKNFGGQSGRLLSAGVDAVARVIERTLRVELLFWDQLKPLEISGFDKIMGDLKDSDRMGDLIGCQIFAQLFGKQGFRFQNPSQQIYIFLEYPAKKIILGNNQATKKTNNRL